MRVPGGFVASVGSCEQAVTIPAKWAQLLDYKINMRMKELYREGYRRFRVIPLPELPRTGDPIRRLVMGWPS